MTADAAPTPARPGQDLAEEMAGSLEQLAALVRAEPLVARRLRWELSGLSGGVLDLESRAGVLRAAAELGVRVAPSAHSDHEFARWTLLFGAAEVVRMVIATERPPRPTGGERPGVAVPERVTSL